VKGECNDKEEKRSFSVFVTAEPHLIFYKDMKMYSKQQAEVNFRGLRWRTAWVICR